MNKKRKPYRYDFILLSVLGVVLFSLVVAIVIKRGEPKAEVKSSVESTVASQEDKKASKSGEVSFFAVGDNLIHGMINYSASNHASTPGDYDFSSFYSGTQAEIEAADVAFINQETPFAGEEVGGLSSYPTFNGPTQILDGLHSAGFDWINLASNHSFDRGEEGILAEIAHVKELGMIQTGVNASQEEQTAITTLEKNGVTIAFESFTYDLNGYTLPEGKDYLVNVTDKELIKQQVEAMKEVSDIQVVNMHWGTEYATTVNEEQKELAQYLADLGVDVIIGEHPHVIEPVDWVTSVDGQKVFVAYSLGNFLSAQSDNINMLGLAVKFSVKLEEENVSVENVQVLPTVTIINGPWNSTQGDFNVKFLKDYTDEDAVNHSLTSIGVDMSRQYFLDQVNQILGTPSDVEIIN